MEEALVLVSALVVAEVEEQAVAPEAERREEPLLGRTGPG